MNGPERASLPTFADPAAAGRATPARIHLATLTSIRFFAAAWVVSFHYELYGWGLPGPLGWIARHGHLGVSLFFVLSGFILAYTYGDRLLEDAFRGRDFFRARIARVYPVYLASLTLGGFQQWRFPAREGIGMLATHPVLAVALNAALLQNWSHAATEALNGPGWSIACEAAFYLAFPLLARWALRLPERRLLPTLVGAAVVGVLLDFLVSNAFVVGSMPPIGGETVRLASVAQGSKYLPFARFDEFFFGILIFRSFRLVSAKRLALGTAVGAIAAVAATVMIALAFRNATLPIAHQPVYTPRIADALAPLFFAALILGLARLGGERPKWLRAPALVYGGKISFALYLVHMPVLYVGLAMAASTGRGRLVLALTLAISLALAAAAYHLVEEPARRWILRRGKGRVRDEGPAPAAP